MKKGVTVNIYGRVQNVGFRYYTQKKAQDLNIRGYVQNMPDGSVYAEAEGEPEKVDRFIDFCRKGPGWARVDKVNVQQAPVKEQNEFKIR